MRTRPKAVPGRKRCLEIDDMIKRRITKLLKKLKMIKLLIVMFALSNSLCSFIDKPKSKVIVVILAHPDDEGAIPQVLAKYGRDNKVYLIIATDGRYGVREHAGIPAGDSLAQVRKKESECACKILGIQPPIFLGLPDGLGIETGVGEFFKQTTALAQMLKENIQQLNPDLIITFGPDGDTGHSDHRHIGAITTQVLLKEGWVEKYPLYYVAWMQKDSDKLKAATGFGLNTVHSKYYNVQIKYSEQDEDKGLASMDCYLSQSTEEERKKWREVEKAEKENILFFRRLAVSNERKTNF